jgi:hypothetical protein
MSPGAQSMKTGPTSSVPLKMSPGAQNLKTGPDAIGTAENVKKEPDALGTAENESGSVKRENRTRHPRYHQKRVRERKT